ncbi:MAG: sigma-54-dependent Fis family transcriptional regulator [Gammaproteobacteria bacterium]
MLTVPTEHAQINDALILESTRLMAKSLPPTQKIVGVLRLLSEWANLPYGRVMVPNYSTQMLHVAYSYGLNSERLQQGDYNVPFDQGLTGAVWRSGQAALVTDVTDEPIFLTRIAEPIHGTKRGVSFICVPIFADGKPIALLSAQRTTNLVRRYSQDMDLLRIAGSMLGTMLLLIQERAQCHVEATSFDCDNERLQQLCTTHGIIGTSAELMAAVKQIDNAKFSDAPILLLGESGTGKEMFAAMAHKLSGRRSGPYIPINCAAIPDQLLEAELFGYEKGSFTGAYKSKKGKLQQAEGGTLFLDEIGDMPMDLQVKLLRVLQDRQVEPVGGDKPIPLDFRLITATHINLRQAITDGRFRLDLFFRLNVMPVVLPPLRKRSGDIARLAQYFLDRYQGMYRRNISFGVGVLERMQAYAWPGNIRQLQNVVERAVLQANGSWITATHIEDILADEAGLDVAPDAAQMPASSAVAKLIAQQAYRPYARFDSSQREHILAILQRSGGNQTRAAAELGLTPRQLRYRLIKLAEQPG